MLQIIAIVTASLLFILNKMRESTVSDFDVLDSFLRESSPDGLTGQYLQLAQVGVVIPNTRVLAIHGGIRSTNFGRIPGMSNTDPVIGNVHQWMDEFNQWYRLQIKSWQEYQPEHLTEPAFTDLDKVCLPSPDKPKSVITANMLGKDRTKIKLNGALID